jgi:hypothetical protein
MAVDHISFSRRHVRRDIGQKALAMEVTASI